MAGLRRALQKDRQPPLVGIHGTVSLRIVHGGDVQLARPELGIRDGHQLVAALHQRRHKAGLTLQHGVVGQVAERQAYQLVDEVRVARAQIVGEVGRHRLLASALLDLVGQRLGDARLLTVAVRVGFAVFAYLIALPLGALAEHDQRIVARVRALLLDEQPDELVEVDLVFGDDAADRGGVRRVERRKAGIAAENAENADSLVRGDGGPLALDGVAGAGDRGREADAVLGVVNVVIHRLRDGNDLHAELVELGRVAERVVTADGNEVLDAQRREVRQHLLGDVPGVGGNAFTTDGERKILAGEVIGQLRHFGRVGAARVQHGAPAPVDDARILTVEGHQVATTAVRILQVQVRQRLPAAPETDELDVVFAAAVGDGFYDRVEARDVAAPSEDADSLFRHDDTSTALSRTPS